MAIPRLPFAYPKGAKVRNIHTGQEYVVISIH